MEQQYKTEVASQAMRYHRKVMTGYVTYLPSEPWRQHLTYTRAAGKHLAGTEFTGGSERMLSSPLEEMKANEMWEKKAEEMMQQNLTPSSRKMNKIRKKMGGSFEIHCMGTRREGKDQRHSSLPWMTRGQSQEWTHTQKHLWWTRTKRETGGNESTGSL